MFRTMFLGSMLVAGMTLLLTARAPTLRADEKQYRFETFKFSDMPRRVIGVKYRAGDARSAVPLGGLGTGTVYFDSLGRFTGQALTNSYRPAGGIMNGCGFTVRVECDGRTIDKPLSNLVRSYMGHFPIVDMEASDDAMPVALQLRGMSPFVLGDSRASAVPTALFRFTAKNTSDKAAKVTVNFQWEAPAASSGANREGNVDGFLVWNLGELPPDGRTTVRVKFAAANSMAELTARLKTPHGNLIVDDDGAFNWEDRGQQCLATSKGGCLSQHGFYLRYNDGRAKQAGTRITGKERLENLIRAGRNADEVRLKTTDNALAIQVLRRDGVLEYVIHNTSARPIKDARLAVYANLEAGHTESDDHGWLDRNLGALVITDATGAACALAGEGSPDAGYCGMWPASIQAMRDDKGVALAKWRMPTDTSAPRRTLKTSGEGSALVTREDPHDHAGCTIAAIGETTPVICENATPEGVSVSASAVLQANETREMRLVLAWFYPDARDSAGRHVGHQYSKWFASSAAVAKYAAEHWDDLTRRTGAWQEEIYDDAKLPAWMKDQLVNSLYSLARNTAWLEDGRFTHSESFIGCPITETIVCRFYGSIPIAMFFPELERNTMRQFIRHQRADGAIAFAFGGGENWDAPYYDTQKVIDSSEFVLMAWRDYTWWNDRAWAAEVYPAVKKAIRFARTLDTDGDSLINDDLSGQYYDCWQFHGASAYTNGIWLAALKAAAEFARTQNDDAFRADCRALLQKAQTSYEEKLWTGQYYRLWNDTEKGRRSDTCLAAQLTGQWYAYASGLGEIVPHEHIVTALNRINRANGAGPVWALVNGITPGGGRDVTGTNGHSQSATLGETWCYAATCVYAGCPELGLPRAARLGENISLRQRRLWNTTWNMNPDTGEMLWGDEYYSNLCVWDLYGAYTGRHSLHESAKNVHSPTKRDLEDR